MGSLDFKCVLSIPPKLAGSFPAAAPRALLFPEQSLEAGSSPSCTHMSNVAFGSLDSLEFPSPPPFLRQKKNQEFPFLGEHVPGSKNTRILLMGLLYVLLQDV